ncbi:MAG TPA: PAS domain S-box protein [Nitrospiraceae bacterium]|nr:PAS domain S-box protein [Nitrospiraceae bacterium]
MDRINKITVEEVDIGAELTRRPSRPPDYEAENHALAELAREMADNPKNILQKLVEVAKDLCKADTAGISLLEHHEGEAVFRWEALAGMYAPYRNYTMPHHASPCGTTIARNAAQLLSMPVRAFPALQADPPIVEGLLIPFHVENRPVGTVWVVSHDEKRKFDAEDERLVRTLSKFAAAGWQLWKARAAAEEDLRGSEAQLAAELAGAEQLQHISCQLIQEENIDALYEQILDAVIAVMRSDMGSMQMLDPEKNALRLLAWRGFDSASAAFWKWVRLDSGSPCGEVLRTGGRVITPDVETCDFITGTDDLDSFRRSGIRAVQSTPLISRDGHIVGMISTHWREPHQPSGPELRVLDVLARQAADLIERKRAEESVRASKAQLQTLFDETPMGIYLVDADFRIRAVNPTALPVFGGIPDLIGRDFDKVIHILWECEYADELVRLFRHTLETGEPYVTPERIERRRDRGAVEYYEWRINRIPLPDGRYGVVCYFRDISVQVFARQAIADSEERYRTLFDSIDEGFCTIEVLFDENGKAVDYRFLQVSPSFVRQTGIENPAGRRMRDIVPQHEEYWFEIYGRVAKTGEPVRFENEAAQLGRWYDVYAFRVEDPQLRRVGLIFNDITERKRAEEALRESEARFRRIFLSNMVAMGVWTKQGGLVGANDALLDLIGYTREELEAGKISWVELTPSKYHERDLQAVAEVEVNGSCVPYEKIFFHKDGRPIPIVIGGGRFDERTGAGIFFAIDLTERKRAEEALRASENKLQSAVAVARISPYQWNPATGALVWETELKAMWGLPPDAEVDYEVFTAGLHPEDRAYVERQVAKAIDPDGEGGYEAEFRVVGIEDKVERWVLARGRTFFDDERRPVDFVGAAQDITERKRAEAALRESQARLQRAHDELDRRVQERTAALSQALIALETEMTERKQAEEARLELRRRLVTAQEDERRRIARELHDQMGQHVTALMLGLKSVHDFAEGRAMQARLQQLQQWTDQIGREIHRLAIELRPTALDDLGLETALSNYAEEWAKQYGIEAAFHCTGLNDHRLPSPVETTLYRIVQEALTNVVKHAQATCVSVILNRRADHVHVIVEDNGKGFDGDLVHEAPHDRLGLLGMQERVTLVGGTMALESTPGSGATIIVRIPLSDGRAIPLRGGSR